MNHDDKIISIKVIIIIIAFQKKMTQFLKSNLLILSSQFPSFFFIQENDTFDQMKRSFFYSFKYHRSDDISRCDRPKRICRIRQIDDNERIRHSLVNCTVKNRRSRETGLGKSKLGVLPPHWWEVVSFMLKQHILRGSAASKIGERCRRIS